MRKITYSCDLCEKELTYTDYLFQTREVRIALKTYDDDGDETSMDLCPTCLTRINDLTKRIKNETKTAKRIKEVAAKKQAKED